jgi:hypothetical protein
MALTPESLRFVRAALEAVQRSGCESQTVLSLGYPDILASSTQLTALFGAELTRALEYRPDSESIARWHGLPHGTRIPDSAQFFALLGYDLEVIDIVATRGGERIQDLNQPVPQELHRRYALVMDPGTLEHCFNIAQAAKNVVELVARGGCVFHGNPMNLYNHGFYNLNPTWYHDFYVANGFVLEAMNAVVDPLRDFYRYDVPATERFREAAEESSLYVLMRRVSEAPVVWPTQTKYVRNPTLKG